MAIPHHGRLDGLASCLERGLPTGDPVTDAACRALLATGMTPLAIVSVLAELRRARPLARTA